MNPPEKRRIGILGGMGPEATVHLMSRIIAITPASDDKDHVPLLVDCNTQVPSRIKAIIEKTGEDPGPVLVQMARRLVAAGAAALAIPCNTAHYYAPLVVEAVPVPLLNMVELSAEQVANLRQSPDGFAIRRVGILASPAVRIIALFDETFAAHGMSTVYSSNPDRILDCIWAIKKDGRNEATLEMLRQSARDLLAMQADVLLVACSEFSIIADALFEEVPIVDTIDVLAHAVVAFSLGTASGMAIAGSKTDLATSS